MNLRDRIARIIPEWVEHPNSELAKTAERNVTFFYYFVVFIAATFVTDLSNLVHAKTLVAPLWPIGWMTYIGDYWGATSILGILLTGSLLAAFRPEYMLFRAMAFLGVFFAVAYMASFGKIDHGYHVLILVLFVLLFLPKRDSREEDASRDREVLFVYGCAQFLVMLTYSLAGFWKIKEAYGQFLKGEIHAFSPDAIALHVAQRLIESNAQSVLGDWVLENHWLVWPFFVGMIFLQLFSVGVVYFPQWQRLWTLGLVSFHIVTDLTMTISFPVNVMVLLLLFWNFHDAKSTRRTG